MPPSKQGPRVVARFTSPRHPADSSSALLAAHPLSHCAQLVLPLLASACVDLQQFEQLQSGSFSITASLSALLDDSFVRDAFGPGCSFQAVSLPPSASPQVAITPDAHCHLYLDTDSYQKLGLNGRKLATAAGRRAPAVASLCMASDAMPSGLPWRRGCSYLSPPSAHH